MSPTLTSIGHARPLPAAPTGNMPELLRWQARWNEARDERVDQLRIRLPGVRPVVDLAHPGGKRALPDLRRQAGGEADHRDAPGAEALDQLVGGLRQRRRA